MRLGLFCLTLPLLSLLSGCGTLQETVPPPRPQVQIEKEPVVAAEPPAAPESAPLLDEAATMLLVRTHLLQLLPCGLRMGTPQIGQMDVIAQIGNDGSLLSLRTGEHRVNPETSRCVLSRVPWWRFPRTGQDRMEVQFMVNFPLQPPSINDNVAVVASGTSGRIDLIAATAELRRIRGKVVSCFHDRPNSRRDEAPSPLLVLLSLRLGEWGKLLDFAVEADNGSPTRNEQNQERSCLRKALRLGEFPNPSGGAVEIHFPYVL